MSGKAAKLCFSYPSNARAHDSWAPIVTTRLNNNNIG